MELGDAGGLFVGSGVVSGSVRVADGEARGVGDVLVVIEVLSNCLNDFVS